MNYTAKKSAFYLSLFLATAAAAAAAAAHAVKVLL